MAVDVRVTIVMPEGPRVVFAVASGNPIHIGDLCDADLEDLIGRIGEQMREMAGTQRAQGRARRG